MSRTPAQLGPRAAVPRGRILGIDPGLQRTGYAVLALGTYPREFALIEAGVVRMSSRTPLPQRLCELHEALDTLITTHTPTTLACEELYAHYKHPRTAILMAHARGVILARAATAGLGIVPVAATNVKKILTGSGHATKRQVQMAVTAMLNLGAVPEPPDVADAIGIAICGARLAAAAQATLAAEVGVRE